MFVHKKIENDEIELNMQPKVKNKNTRLLTKRGFSIGEIMLAAFVLSVAMIAAINLLIVSFSNSAKSRDRVVASMLAQEGIEVVRNIRDNNWAAGRDTFNEGYFPGTNRIDDSNDKGCAVDKDSTEISDTGSCGSGFEVKDLFIDASGYYVGTGATTTGFKRKVMVQYFNSAGAEINDRANAASARLSSVVIWGNTWPLADLSNCTFLTKCVFAKTVLTKWGE